MPKNNPEAYNEFGMVDMSKIVSSQGDSPEMSTNVLEAGILPTDQRKYVEGNSQFGVESLRESPAKASPKMENKRY